MQALVVSIGRNIGAEPMPNDVWQDFRDDVASVILGFGLVVFTGFGDGDWNEDDEESWTVIVSVGGQVSERDAEYRRVLAELSALCDNYDQDAIAVTLGTTVFATRREVA
ncbi:MAG: hypothetical protein ACRDGA_14465 [Bacteroidota bacterium]